MAYVILLILGVSIPFLIWLLKQVYVLKEDVSTLQQNAIDLEYTLQRGWENNSEKIKRLVKRLDPRDPLPFHCVTYKSINRKLYVTSPQMNLLTLAWEDNIAVSSGCYGEGTCGQCAFVPLEGTENISPCGEKEKRALQMFNYPPNARLSCQSRVHGDVALELLQPLRSL